MFEYILPILKAFGRDVLLLAVGIVIGLLLSNVLKSHYRNECMASVRMLMETSDDAIHYNNNSHNINTIEQLCGKAK